MSLGTRVVLLWVTLGVILGVLALLIGATVTSTMAAAGLVFMLASGFALVAFALEVRLRHIDAVRKARARNAHDHAVMVRTLPVS